MMKMEFLVSQAGCCGISRVTGQVQNASQKWNRKIRAFLVPPRNGHGMVRGDLAK